jgi:hypothetical protein
MCFNADNKILGSAFVEKFRQQNFPEWLSAAWLMTGSQVVLS